MLLDLMCRKTQKIQVIIHQKIRKMNSVHIRSPITGTYHHVTKCHVTTHMIKALLSWSCDTATLN